jgi:hypothetical protein
MTTTTTKTLTVESLRVKWIGRSVYASSDHRLNAAGMHPRQITDLHYNAREDQYFAFSGEHHIAGSLEALDRRLESLAVR